jgi:hypothetical protein
MWMYAVELGMEVASTYLDILDAKFNIVRDVYIYDLSNTP